MSDSYHRNSRRRVYRRRRTVFFVLLSLVIYGFTALVLPAPSADAVVTAETSLVSSPSSLAWPETGSGAIFAPDYDGAVEYHGSRAAIPIASITKVITALVILDAKPIPAGSDGPSITFNDKDAEIWQEVVTEGGSWAPVYSGTVMTQTQALTAMMLPSANNYAISLSKWAFGSIDEFLVAAKEWLADNDLQDTELTSPDGLDAGNISSTEDLLRIGELAIKHPLLSKIVSQKEATLPDAGLQKNTNRLIGVNGIDGLKTGNTDEAGYCLLFSAEILVAETPIRVIGVVLGTDNRSDSETASQNLLESMIDGFHEVDLAVEGQSFASYTTAWGAQSALIAASNKKIAVWSDSPVTVALKHDRIVGAKAGDITGKVIFTVNKTEYSVDLKLEKDIAAPSLAWRLAHPGGFGS